MYKNKIYCTIFRGLWNRCCNSTRSTSLLNGSGRYENKISDSEKKMSNIKIYCSKFQRERLVGVICSLFSVRVTNTPPSGNNTQWVFWQIQKLRNSNILLFVDS
jgi:hypothetical protein